MIRKSHIAQQGFTLVELLVVIAIISVLAALLLPSLEGAIEQSRRVVCAGNQKQLYVTLNLYADSNGDALPFSGSPSVRAGGNLYGTPINDSVMNWLCDYANVGRGPSQYSPMLNEANRIIDCPSAHQLVYPLVYQSNRSNRTQWFDYALPGIGALLDSTARRTPAFSSGPLGPKAVVQDITQRGTGYAWTYNLDYYNNHGEQGGNVIDGSGGIRWTPLGGFASELGTSGDGGLYRATAYYYQGGPNYFMRRDCRLYVYRPPSGTFTGSIAFSDDARENLRMYGYR